MHIPVLTIAAGCMCSLHHVLMLGILMSHHPAKAITENALLGVYVTTKPDPLLPTGGICKESA